MKDMHMNHSAGSHKNYWHLAIMTVLNFIAMYVLMYAMVDVLMNVHPNHNQFYMAVLMTAPMLILELVCMGSMYPMRKWNLTIVSFGALLLVSSFFFIRQQVAIGDQQLLHSMIPHHAGAILMCEKANLQDTEVEEFCANIASTQKREIDWMKAKLNALK